ncbi:MAG: GFA family protein [Gammaproteobacteria bacterium]
MTESIRGSCLCGGVSYILHGSVAEISNCHCSTCRRQHGSAFSTYAKTASRDLEICTGLDLIQCFQSSPHATREFCRRCGSKLFYRSQSAPNQVWLDAGCLDDDPGVGVSQHVFVASKAEWHDICDDLPQHSARPHD